MSQYCLSSAVSPLSFCGSKHLCGIKSKYIIYCRSGLWTFVIYRLQCVNLCAFMRVSFLYVCTYCICKKPSINIYVTDSRLSQNAAMATSAATNICKTQLWNIGAFWILSWISWTSGGGFVVPVTASKVLSPKHTLKGTEVGRKHESAETGPGTKCHDIWLLRLT